MSTEESCQIVFNFGEVVGVYDAPKQQIEKVCVSQTNETPYKYDWSYFGGRAVIKRILKSTVEKIEARLEVGEKIETIKREGLYATA